jgi:subtilisin family serine protease
MGETQAPRLLLKLPADAPQHPSLAVAGNSWRMRPLCPNEERRSKSGIAASSRWYLAEGNPGAATAAELWELAYAAVDPQRAQGGSALYAEPDLLHPWLYENRVRPDLAAAPGDLCAYTPQDTAFPGGPVFAWHLGDDFSQLKSARDTVTGGSVRIGILDTGFDFAHRTAPREPRLRTDLARNFVDDGQAANDASDPYVRGAFNNPGHGTGTLGLLAGERLSGMLEPEQNTGDFLGGAPAAEIIPVRIATGVVLLRTSAFVEAIDYLIAPGGDPALRADVVSMSMGGLASSAWADVVNRAYEAGICIVTAAGNNIAFPPSPQSIVYPARFHRVIAACGIMADGRPYVRAEVPPGRMAGNFGPDSKMATALAAYTPNTPWAEINCPAVIDDDGAGTSSATPQIAAAAALWLQRHKSTLTYNEPWMIVEAARRGLFASAGKVADEALYPGWGVLRAREALDIAPAPAADLRITPADDARFAIFDVLTGRAFAATSHHDMLQVEARQLLQRDPEIEATLPDPDLPAAELDVAGVKRFVEAAIESQHASPTLRNHLKDLYTSRFRGAELRTLPPESVPYQGRPTQLPAQPPTCRRLRAYALDPAIASQLEMTEISQTVLDVRWEDLRPGPIGEYLEVIDLDPPSGGFYAPVDLNDPSLLAQDGLAPAESDPKFHQQFVYAVAMKTIETFERALGRKAMWSPRLQGGADSYVERLRIYPHALREENAYYHPGKKALLFGYFAGRARDPGQIYPQGIVFTCLSHDIVAHETTHALLDGMHRNFNRPSNRDQLAFHEAFADIVALFQHFAMSGVVRHQIARTRGNLRARNILGELASQFGHATDRRGALRSYIGKTDEKTGAWQPLAPDPTAYERLTKVHDRGALLVAAVFDAFVSIYERRSADLVRLASGGTGELPTGAIHPDLVNRLSEEAVKAASHVLTMCVRALDYCPPLDLTFGDYLRALITADHDLVPYDPLCYRVAFVEAFRRRGIYPKDLTTLSGETLRWNPAEREGDDLKKVFAPVLKKLREFAAEVDYIGGVRKGTARELSEREGIFNHTRTWRSRLGDQLRHEISKVRDAAARRRLATVLGLDLRTGKEPFELQSLQLSRKGGPNETTVTRVILTLVQERLVETGADGSPLFPFSGGSTIVADIEKSRIEYVICKNILSAVRRKQQVTFDRQARWSSLPAIYFGENALTGADACFAMLHAAGENHDV